MSYKYLDHDTGAYSGLDTKATNYGGISHVHSCIHVFEGKSYFESCASDIIELYIKILTWAKFENN